MHAGELAGAASVVVYAGFKSAADALAAQLSRAGVDAAAYHAGKNLAQREAVQAAFLGNRLRVVVATVAFGMVRPAHAGGSSSFERMRLTLRERTQMGPQSRPPSQHVLLRTIN